MGVEPFGQDVLKQSEQIDAVTEQLRASLEGALGAEDSHVLRNWEQSRHSVKAPIEERIRNACGMAHYGCIKGDEREGVPVIALRLDSDLFGARFSIGTIQGVLFVTDCDPRGWFGLEKVQNGEFQRLAHEFTCVHERLALLIEAQMKTNPEEAKRFADLVTTASDCLAKRVVSILSGDFSEGYEHYLETANDALYKLKSARHSHSDYVVELELVEKGVVQFLKLNFNRYLTPMTARAAQDGSSSGHFHRAQLAKSIAQYLQLTGQTSADN